MFFLILLLYNNIMDFGIIPVAEASITTLMASISRVIINPLIVFMFALAVVYFLYGLALYFMSPDNEEMKKNSKQHMIWGVVGMFIMVSVFGIINLTLKIVGENKINVQNGCYSVTL